jgi:hypothetical protein
VLSVAVYVVLAASGALGVSVAVLVEELYATVAATLPDELLSVKLELVIVVESIERENVALGKVPTTTPVALLAGEVEVTVGAELTVVKLQLYAEASATPSADLTAVVSVAVYAVLFANAALGVSVAVFVDEL